MNFNKYKKTSELKVVTPKTINDLIQISSISSSGIFKTGDRKYTKTYKINDFNYDMLNVDEKIGILEKWCEWINSMQLPYKLSVNNKNRDMELYRKNVMFKQKDASNDFLSLALNNEIEKRISDEKGNCVQEIYLTITAPESKTYKIAANFFDTFEKGIKEQYEIIGTSLVPLDASERLRVLHDFFRTGEEENFSFDFNKAVENNSDYLSYIIPGMLDFTDEKMIVSATRGRKRYSTCLYAAKYQDKISDRFLTKLSRLNTHMMLSLDVVPISDSDSRKMLEKKYVGVNRLISKQNSNLVRNLDFNSEITKTVTDASSMIKTHMDDFKKKQRYFYVMLNIIISADSEEELFDAATELIETARINKVDLEYSYLRTKEALNTVLPLGGRYLSNGRIMQTRGLAGMFPFRSCDIYHPTGLWYGNNPESGENIFADRKRLLNPHGILVGVTGSGKTMAASIQIIEAFLKTNDDLIIIDPKNDYKKVIEVIAGTYIDVNPAADMRFNPLYYNDTGKRLNIADEKTELVLSLCETGKKEPLTAKERSIISRALKISYDKAGADEVTLTDLYENLNDINEKEAHDVMLYLEIFIKGSLSIFAEKNSVTPNNRVTAFGLRNMGTELRDFAMLAILETIKERVFLNYSAGKATWLFIDELPQVLKNEYQQTFINSIWVLFRSLGCIITGNVQTITQLLVSYKTRELIENSEFFMIFKQKEAAKDELASCIALSEAELNRVTGQSKPGCGILKYGKQTVSFDMSISKDTELYNLLNTNFHEIYGE